MSRDRLRLPVGALGALLVAVAAVFIVWRVAFFSAMPRTLTHLSFDSPDGSFALSSDGNAVAYAVVYGDDPQLFVRRLDGSRPHHLPGTEGAAEPFFSPDGERLGFRRSGRIEVVPTSGAEPDVLCELRNGFGARWTESGILFGTDAGLIRVSETGREEALTSLAENETAHRFPEAVPGTAGTEWIVFEVRTDTGEAPRLDVVSTTTGERRTILESGAMPRYASTGDLLFRREGSLWAVPFDTNEAEISGAPVLAIEAVGLWYDVSMNGTLAFEHPRRGDEPIIVSVVVHWFEELKRLAPHGKGA